MQNAIFDDWQIRNQNNLDKKNFILNILIKIKILPGNNRSGNFIK